MSDGWDQDSATYLADRAMDLAQNWASAAAGDPDEQRIASILNDENGLAFLRGLLDGVIWSESVYAAAAGVQRLAPIAPELLPWYLRSITSISTVGGAVASNGSLATMLATPFVPLVRRMARELLAPYLITGQGSGQSDRQGDRMTAALAELHTAGYTRLGATIAGDPVLGGASARLGRFGELIQRDGIDHISFSLAEVSGTTNLWAFDDEVARISELLLPTFLLAAEHGTTLMLDIDAYHDFDLTIAVFARMLEEEQLAQLHAGITLPAYLPDSFPALQELIAWARGRVAGGAAPITVRLTKGGRLAAEQTDAKLRGLTAATYDTKLATDANFLRCLEYALRPKHTAATRVAVATHNVFDIAFAWQLAGDRELRAHLEFEAQLGVATALIRVVQREIEPLRLRVRIAEAGQLAAAASEVLQQIEQLAVSDNFLSAAAALPGDAALFARERERFLTSVQRSLDPGLLAGPKRSQPRAEPDQPDQASDSDADDDAGLTQQVLGIADHNQTQPQEPRGQAVLFGGQPFVDTAVFTTRESDPSAVGAPGFKNAADTDPTLASNRAWADQVRARIPDSEAGMLTQRSAQVSDVARLDEIVRRVCDSASAWGRMPAAERARQLRPVAGRLQAARAELIEAAMADAGLLFADADAQVSEVVDDAGYYAATADELDRVHGAVFQPARVTVVTASAGQPFAGVIGDVLAGLAAGSGVILAAPNLRTLAVAAEAIWAAGVSRDLFDLTDPDSVQLRQDLISHADVDQVIHRGDYETAAEIRSWRPELPMLGDGGGVNIAIVTASADLDAAARQIADSAFSRVGAQAISTVILVGAAARSERFTRQLRDIAASLVAVAPTDSTAQVAVLPTPVLPTSPGKRERWALTELAEGEQWLLQPSEQQVDQPWQGRVWSPGIRTGVQPGGRMHTERFPMPVLGLIQTSSLSQAIEWSNTETVRTAALYSRDPNELELWLDRVEAGTLVVGGASMNRRAQRYPSGGGRHALIGPNAKAGGPNYLVGFGRWQSAVGQASATLHLRGLDSRITDLIEAAQPTLDYSAFEWLRRAALSDAVAWDREFKRVRDVSHLGVERNLFRYRPTEVEIRTATDAAGHELLRVVVAGVRAGSAITVSVPDPLDARVAAVLTDLGVLMLIESESDWLDRVGQNRTTAVVQPAVDAAVLAVGYSEVGADENPFDTPAVARPRRLRLVGTPAQVAHLRASLAAVTDGDPEVAVYDNEVTTAGRIELLPFLREQSITISSHRRGHRDDWSDSVI